MVLKYKYKAGVIMDEVNIIITNITNLENAVVKAKRYNAVKMEMALMNINSARKELKKALEEKQIAEDLKKEILVNEAISFANFIEKYLSKSLSNVLFGKGIHMLIEMYEDVKCIDIQNKVKKQTVISLNNIKNDQMKIDSMVVGPRIRVLRRLIKRLDDSPKKASNR